MGDKDDGLIKIIVIGDSMVGKTAFIHRYVNDTYRPEYKSTIGVDFALKIIPWTDPHQIKIQLWDIAGQERFTYMTRAYYRDARGCILMFDISNAYSFNKVKKWKEDLDSKARLEDGSHIPCLLMASKCDLTERQVSKEQMFEMCRDMGFVGWTETSSQEDVMVKESVLYLLDIITGRANTQSPSPKRRPLPNRQLSGIEESVKLHQHQHCHRRQSQKQKKDCQC